MKKRIFDVTCSIALLISLVIIAAGVTSYADMIKKEDITNLEQELETIKKRQEATEKELAEIEKDENYVESSIAYSEELIKGYTEYVKLLSNIIAGYDAAIEETEEQIDVLKAKYDDVQPNGLFLQENTITLPCYEGIDVEAVCECCKRFVSEAINAKEPE